MKTNESGTISGKGKAFCVGASVIMGILIVASFFAILHFAFLRKESVYLQQIISVTGMLFAEILFIGCCFNIRENPHQGYIFAAASALLFANIMLSGAMVTLDGVSETRYILYAIQVVISIVSVIIHILLWRYQRDSLPKNYIQKYFNFAIYALAAIYTVMLIVNVFTGFLFYVDELGYMRWPGDTIELAFVVAFYVLYLIYVLLQKCSLKKKAVLASFAIFPLSIIMFEVMWAQTGNSANVLSVLYIFILLAAYVVFFCDYMESQKLLSRQNAEMAEQAKKQTELRTALMLSQIRPHFLYNTLTAIRNLCKNNPQEAYDALGGFADYLRRNMEALGSGRIIPFEQELEHIKTYLMLEQLRFGDELKVEFDIGYQDFSLPALSVQPIVENAVKYGATMNECGGKVTVRTDKVENGAVITVIDNGPGFNPDVPPSDGVSHFGLKNVRNCLLASDRGELEIQSKEGEGTTVKIFIREEKV